MRASRFIILPAIAAVAAVPLLSAPASAGGLFEALFGGLRQAAREVPAAVSSFADPFAGMRQSSDQPRGDVASGYCVRTCDGKYFKVQGQGGMSAADMCSAYCPATETKVYSGGAIDYATARDGSRYSDMPNAYVYRQKLVAGCSCNGKTPGGLANIDAKSDPTLRPGDIVASPAGLSAFTGAKNKVAEFTPISNYRSLPQSYRDKLAETKVAPENAMAMAPVALTSTKTEKNKLKAAEQPTDIKPERLTDTPARSYNARWSND